MTSDQTHPTAPISDGDLQIAREAAAQVCHADQLATWADDLVSRLSMVGYLREDLDYEDKLGLHRDVSDEIKDVVQSAFTHPELALSRASNPPPENALAAVCEPWRFSTGNPPDYESPLMGVFGAGMAYTESLLAKLLGVERFEGGDGSEDFDCDATKTLSNILTAAKLYDPEDGRWAALAAAPPVPNRLRADADAVPWRDMATAPHDKPIVAKHRPNEHMPHGWVGTITRGDPKIEDDRFGNPDTILHYNGDRLIGRFYGCWEGWLPLDDASARLAPASSGQGDADGWRDVSDAPRNKAIQIYIPNADYYGNNGVYAGMLVDMGTGPHWMAFAWAMGRDLPADLTPTRWRLLPAAPVEPGR